MAAIPPSVSSEYLRPKGQTKTQTASESITDHQAIVQHPLLPLISSILRKHANQTVISASECTLLRTFNSKSEMDIFMREAVSLATQLSEDKSNIGNLMQSIDNEGSYFTSEMSMFCRNLLQPDLVPTGDSSEHTCNPIQQSPMANHNPPIAKDKVAKENKSKIKSVHKVGKKHARLSQRSTQILREWLLEHADNPFPNDNEKDVLCLRTGLSLSKLNTWFVNSRRRILAPLGLKNYQNKTA